MTPNTTHTFFLGYSVATIIYATYIVSLFVRTRRAKQRVDDFRSARR